MNKFQDIVNSEDFTLVDFFATWCSPCKMMAPILDEFKSQIDDSVKVLKVDVDKNEELSLHYRIQSVPTLLLFKKGEVVWRHSGVISAGHLVKLIGQYQ